MGNRETKPLYCSLLNTNVCFLSFDVPDVAAVTYHGMEKIVISVICVIIINKNLYIMAYYSSSVINMSSDYENNKLSWKLLMVGFVTMFMSIPVSYTHLTLPTTPYV